MWRTRLALLSTVSLIPGCIAPAGPLDPNPADPAVRESLDAAPEPPSSQIDDDRVRPPDDWMPLARSAHRQGPATLCLEFEGATIEPDESFIIPAGRPLRVPRFDALNYGVADRGEAIAYVLGRVREHYDDTALVVTEVCPADDAVTRVIVGGTPRLVREHDGVAGIAPFDVGNVLDDDIGFAFSEVLGRGRGRADLDQLAAVISHEAGHTFGLDHVRPPRDLMFPTVNDSMIGFTAAEALDGQWQDSPALLLAALGTPGPEVTPDAAEAPFDCDPADEVSGSRRDRAEAVVSGQLSGGQACRDDDDWFAFDAAEGDDLTLDLAYPDQGWVEPPALYRPRGRLPIGTPTSEDGVHHLTARAEMAGRYRIRVSTSDALPWRYALRIRVEPAR